MSEHEYILNPSLAKDIHVEATQRLTEALVASENRMRRRLQMLTEVVFETDAAGHLVFLNNAWGQALGYEPEKSIGHPLRDFVLEEDLPALEQVMAAQPARAEAAPPALRFRRRDGSLAWMEMSLSLLEGGGSVGALHDVTRQRHAQTELAKLSLVASFTDNLVVITDRHGKIEWINQAFVNKTGYTLNEVIGRKPGDVLQGPDTDRNTVVQVAKWLAEGRPFQAELLNYTKSKEPYWVSVHVNPIRDAQGNVERFVAVQTDITELRRTQRELENAKERAESANIAKTHFLATMSHEMRTPLNVILGHADLALEDAAEHREALSHLPLIRDNAEILLRLITDLLDISKIESGQIEMENIPFRLRPCLERALAPIATRAQRKQLHFRVRHDDSLPAQVIGDPDRVRQIITNLAENAVKFTDQGYVQVEFSRLECRNTGAPCLEIRVLDSGIGISPDAQTRIFDRFEQGDSSTTRRKGGAGLGLSIVKSLVEAMGGSVSLRSAPDQGADFCVRLPLAPIAEDAAATHTSHHQVAASPANPVTGRILVAEDTDANFSILDLYLSKAGHHVERAVNGQVAATAATRERFDLILMDIEMPEMDGLQATRLIRKDESQRGLTPVPILALTAHALQGYRERCLAAGCTGYLAKPIRKQVLLEAVANALEDSRVEPTPAPTPTPAATLQPETLLDPDLAAFIPEFLDYCRSEADRLAGAVKQEDYGLAARIGHDLKGSAPALGFENLGQLGREIENHAKSRSHEPLSAAVAQLREKLSLTSA